jgi:hypothetical protein
MSKQRRGIYVAQKKFLLLLMGQLRDGGNYTSKYDKCVVTLHFFINSEIRISNSDQLNDKSFFCQYAHSKRTIIYTLTGSPIITTVLKVSLIG